MIAFETICRLKAYRLGHAVPRTARRHIDILPHARVLALLKMAGEHASMHIVLFGPLAGGPPRVFFAPEPRDRGQQYRAFRGLGRHLLRYLTRCEERQEAPQIWVPSGSTARHLRAVSGRLLSGRQKQVVRQLGGAFAFLTRLRYVAGQQLFVIATEALQEHYAAGHAPSDDDHLGALLAWTRARREGGGQQAAWAAEKKPMGIRPRPSFETEELMPLLDRYTELRRRRAPEKDLKRLEDALRGKLLGVLWPIYENTQKAARFLRDDGPPPLPALPELVKRGQGRFERFMKQTSRGLRMRQVPSPCGESIFFQSAEIARENYQAALYAGDELACHSGIKSGRVLQATIRRADDLTLIAESTQPVLRAREGRRLTYLQDMRLAVEVQKMRTAGDAARITLVIRKGMRGARRPRPGEEAIFLPAAPDWHLPARQGGKISRRLKKAPWTHRRERLPGPGESPHEFQGDPLDFVRSLRGQSGHKEQ